MNRFRMSLQKPGLAGLLFLTCISIGASAGEDDHFPPGDLQWRNIGPVNMSGRVADVEGVPGNPNIVYVGSASGGVWKTVNGGVTFEPIFDDQPIASIGDLALASDNPDVIYVGSGEANTRNSVSFGNGVYGSTDGGKTWTHLGLEDTRHISRVLVHPADSNTVFVGAVGHIFGPNEQRGVFRSEDGGQTWTKTLYLDDIHGVSDMDISQTNPNILFAALWHFNRKPWTHTSGSEKGGLYKSVDNGKTWKKITKGLPKLMGRIAVKIAPSNPNVVYVMAESNDGVLFRSNDQGESFEKVSDNVSIVSRGFYYTDMRVDPRDENRVYSVSSRMFVSLDGGRHFDRFSASTHVDYHSLWIDPENPNRMWQGQDGGVAVSYDRGEKWEPIRNLPLAQFYQIYADNREPFYYLGGGLQDNGAWYGPSRTREPAGIMSDDWRMVSFGDAYYMVAHPDNPELIISEWQGGGIVRTDMTNRHQQDINPQPRRNDGGPVGELEYRFSWNAPIIPSHFDKDTVFFTGNVVFKSEDFGTTWQKISPDLTTNDKEKQGNAGGPVWKENTTAEYHCTIVSFAQSPLDKDILWTGSDDGKLYMTRDGGKNWSDLTGNIKNMPEFSPISHIEPSKTGAGVAYAAFDRHMFDDFKGHIYRTDNYGKSWKNISGNLPDGAWVWVVKEDPKNPDMLYAGTELGLYVSYTKGNTWQRFHLANLPTVAIHDLIIHPRENDLILGTHGRGLWIFDDATPLQNYAAVADKGKPHLFGVRPGLRFPSRFTRYGIGDKKHTAPNPPDGAIITYYLPESLEKPEEKAKSEDDKTPPAPKKDRLKFEILDQNDQLVRTLKNPSLKMGMNRITWNLDAELARPRKEREGGDDFFGPARGPYVVPGAYKVRMTLDGQTFDQTVEVKIDPTLCATDKELKAQYDMVENLTDMKSRVNDALRNLDLIKEQLGQRKAALKTMKKEMAEDLKTEWKDFEKQLTELMDQLSRPEGKTYWSQGPRLVGRIDELARNVNGAFSAPNAAQAFYFKALEKDVKDAMDKCDAFFTQTTPAFNQNLEKHQIPYLSVIKN